MSDRSLRDFQFIASRELTLETYNKFGSKALCELGFGEPGEKFWMIKHSDYYLLPDTLHECQQDLLDLNINNDPEYGDILIICGYQDNLHARKRCEDRLRAEEQAELAEKHAELMARLQRVPVIRAWNYMTSSISRAISSLKPQCSLSQIKTCWRQRHIGDYEYLEETEIMKEKEYWCDSELAEGLSLSQVLKGSPPSSK